MPNSKTVSPRGDRIAYLDYLRIFAVAAVVVLHVASQNWLQADVNGRAWLAFNFFDSMVRWGVPVLVMISGALFLRCDISVRKIFSKNILRLVIAFVFWSAVYLMLSIEPRHDWLVAIIEGRYHMWFIPMIIGLYICVPFLRPLAENKKATKYFVAVSFIVASVIPTMQTLTKDFMPGSGVARAISADIENMNYGLVLGYIVYFVLGHFLNPVELKKPQRTVIYILGVAGFAATILLDHIVAVRTGAPYNGYYDNFSVNVFFEAVAVFTWFKYRGARGERGARGNRGDSGTRGENRSSVAAALAEYSFGAYLVHILILERLDYHFDLNTLSFEPAAAVAVVSLIVIIVSFAISAILNQIPVARKYIV